MKNYLTIAALAAAATLVSVSAQAQAPNGAKTRAQVVAELAQARASGELERMASIGFGLPEPVVRTEGSVAVPEAAGRNGPAPSAAERPGGEQVRADAR